MFYQTNRTQAAERAEKFLFFPGDLDLDLQTRPSKGPNTSSVWTGRKSVQWFPWYFIYKQKNPQTDGAKNRTLHSSLGVVNMTLFTHKITAL